MAEKDNHCMCGMIVCIIGIREREREREKRCMCALSAAEKDNHRMCGMSVCIIGIREREREREREKRCMCALSVAEKEMPVRQPRVASSTLVFSCCPGATTPPTHSVAPPNRTTTSILSYSNLFSFRLDQRRNSSDKLFLVIKVSIKISDVNLPIFSL